MTLARPAPHFALPRRRRARGFSLVELLVALAIGLILTLAMSSALVVGESHKRTTGSTTDMDQSGAYAASIIDTLVRSAGSGLMQSETVGARVLGCPMTGIGNNLPQPFSSLSGGSLRVRVAPVLIAKNLSSSYSDVLVVMSGSVSAGGISRRVENNSVNSVGIENGDLALVSSGNNTVDCTVGLVSGAPSTSLKVDGTPVSGFVTPLGSSQGGDVQFQLLGVGSDSAAGSPNKNMLYSYDLLHALDGGSNQAQAVASDVYALHALYGIADTADGNLPKWKWVDPGATGYDINTMMSSDPDKLKQIIAIRVALVLKSSLYEKTCDNSTAPARANEASCLPTTPPTLTWFKDDPNLLPAANCGRPDGCTQTLTPDPNYRYRVIEFVVPVRNNLI